MATPKTASNRLRLGAQCHALADVGDGSPTVGLTCGSAHASYSYWSLLILVGGGFVGIALATRRQGGAPEGGARATDNSAVARPPCPTATAT
jgi:hypothetical protein